MGSLVKLMVNEKMVVALVRIRDKGETEQSIPLGFKINKSKIPDHIKFDKFHSNNMHNLTVPGIKPLPVMIVCVGEDSQEIIPIYKAFCERTIKEKKIPGLSDKISHWIGVSDISLVKIDKSAFKPILLKEFNSFMKHVESISKSEKGNSKQKEHEVVTLSDENSSHATKSSLTPAESMKTTFCDSSAFLKEHGSSFQDYGNIKNLISSTKDLAIKYKAAAIVLPSTDATKSFFNELAQILMNLLEIVDKIERSMTSLKQEVPAEPSISDLRIISEEDQTKEHGNVTLIEGLLPVKTSRYKKALTALPSEINDREPSHFITNIAKFCFPDHWIIGVTLKGSGGNKSLLDLWNYENPLKFPLSGKIDRQLGFDRYQALVDHTMRKCGKKSYLGDTEKHLATVLSKAIHYRRTKLNQPKGWDDISDSSSDEDDGKWLTSPNVSMRSNFRQEEDDDDDEIIPPRRNRVSRIRIDESFAAKPRAEITIPDVSMKVGPPISYDKGKQSVNEPAIMETGDNNEDDHQGSHPKGGEKEDDGDILSKNANENKDHGQKDSPEDLEKLPEDLGDVKDSQSEESFKFDDDDEVLGPIDYLKDTFSPPSPFASDEENEKSKKVEKEDKSTDEKMIEESTKVVQPVFSSTPLSKKVHPPFTQVTPIRPSSANVKNIGISDTISSESGIEVSAIEASSSDRSIISSDQLASTSTSENKRKNSNSSLSDAKKIKSTNNDHEDESNTSTLSAGSTAAIKFMDPQTLAFINDPANVAFLQQLIAAKAMSSSTKN